MKVAILLCGQLRTFEMCKWNVKHMLQDKYDCDVFMSIDKINIHQLESLNSKNDTNTADIQYAVNFIKPIKYYIMDDTAFNKDYNLFNIDEKTCFTKYNDTKNNYTYNKSQEIRKSILESDFSTSEYLKFKTPYFKTEDMQYSTFNKENYIKILRQYFIVNECYNMLIEHIITTGTHYDLIIKLRFDQLIWTDGYNLLLMCKEVNEYGPLYNERNIDIIKENTLGLTLNLDHSQENTIKVFGGGILNTYGYVNDQFWTHGMDLIHIMSQFYKNISRIINQVHREHMPYSGGNIEHIFLRFLFDNNIKIKKSIIKGIFIREFSSK